MESLKSEMKRPALSAGLFKCAPGIGAPSRREGPDRRPSGAALRLSMHPYRLHDMT
jgi:hypothetical protein